MNEHEQSVYFAGGVYYPSEKRTDKKTGRTYTVSLLDKQKRFEAVRPTANELPYLTHDPKGLRLCDNGNLYCLSEDGKVATLAQYRCLEVTPMEQHEDGSFWPAGEITLPEEVAKALQEAIKAGHFYD